jgi:hypothetical protein
MKMFDFLSVHPRIGPYITMAGKMVLAMSYIIVLLMVTLMAFGVGECCRPCTPFLVCFDGFDVFVF